MSVIKRLCEPSWEEVEIKLEWKNVEGNTEKYLKNICNRGKNMVWPCVVQFAMTSKEFKDYSSNDSGLKQVTLDLSYLDVCNDAATADKMLLEILEKYSGVIIPYGGRVFDKICRGEGKVRSFISTQKLTIYYPKGDFAPLIMVGLTQIVNSCLKSLDFQSDDEVSEFYITKDWHILEGLRIEKLLRENSAKVYIQGKGDEAYLLGTKESHMKAKCLVKKLQHDVKKKLVNFNDKRCEMLLFDMNGEKQNNNVLAHLIQKTKQISGNFFIIISVPDQKCVVYGTDEMLLDTVCAFLQNAIHVVTCSENIKHHEEYKDWVGYGLLMNAGKGLYICVDDVRKKIEDYMQKESIIPVPDIVKEYFEKFGKSSLKSLEKKYSVSCEFLDGWSELRLSGFSDMVAKFKSEFKNLYHVESFPITSLPTEFKPTRHFIQKLSNTHRCCSSVKLMAADCDEKVGECSIVASWLSLKEKGKLNLVEGQVSGLPQKCVLIRISKKGKPFLAPLGYAQREPL